MSSLRDEIADLEARIESLSDAAERCRKIITVCKAVLVGGALLLGSTAFGVIRFDPIFLVLGITAVLAGIALSGSNRSTLEELRGKIEAHEALRKTMIDRIGLRVVESA